MQDFCDLVSLVEVCREGVFPEGASTATHTEWSAPLIGFNIAAKIRNKMVAFHAMEYEMKYVILFWEMWTCFYVQFVSFADTEKVY